MYLSNKDILKNTSHFLNILEPVILSFNIRGLYDAVANRYNSLPHAVIDKARNELIENGYIFAVNKTIIKITDYTGAEGLVDIMIDMVYQRIAYELKCFSNCSIWEKDAYASIHYIIDCTEVSQYKRRILDVIKPYNIKYEPKFMVETNE